MILAYLMAAYVFASIYYLIMTRKVGTPFRDSLTKEQLEIKNKSASVRKNIFFTGIMLGLVLLLIFRPFASCS